MTTASRETTADPSVAIATESLLDGRYDRVISSLVTADPKLLSTSFLRGLALFARGRTRIEGAEELRVKETDRLRAMSCELVRMGGDVTERRDGLIIEGTGKLHTAECLAYADHRVAMALTVAGMASEGVCLDDAGCVAISFPGFFEVMEGCRA